MPQHSPKEFMRVIQWVDPDSHSTSTDIATLDSAIDTIGFRYLVVIVNVGDSAGTWDIAVEAASTSGGSYSDITGASFSVTTGSDNGRFVGVVDLFKTGVRVDRFVQLNGTSATGAIDLGVTAILFAPGSDSYVDFSSGGNDELTFEVA